MASAVIFIDGGHLSKIQERFGKPRIDFRLFSAWCCREYSLYRTYYYDCLPYMPAKPTAEDSGRLSNKQKFFNALRRTDRFVLRLGRLEYRGADEEGKPIFQQKRVDLQLGLDLASIVTKTPIEMVVLVAGDSDLLPAVEHARNEGRLVRLVHGPVGTYHDDLFKGVDERFELTSDVLRQCTLK